MENRYMLTLTMVSGEMQYDLLFDGKSYGKGKVDLRSRDNFVHEMEA